MWRNCLDKIRKNRTSFLSLERYMSIIKSDLKFECWRILTDCHSSTVSFNFVWDTAPSGLRAGLNNVWLSKSDKIGSHLIIVFTRLLLEKKIFSFVQTKSQDGVNSLFQEAISVIFKSLPTCKIGFQTFIRARSFK